MSLGFLLSPRWPVAVSAEATAGMDAAFPASALLDEQPKVVVQSSTSATAPFSLTMTLDFGADIPIDTVAVMFTNLSAAGTWSVWATPASAGSAREDPADLLDSGAFGLAPTVSGRARHGLWAGTLVQRRWLRVRLTEPALTAEPVIRVGLVLAGERWQPGTIFGNFDLGAQRSLEDRSIKRSLPGGESHVERAAKVPGWQAVWSALTHEEMRRIWGLLAQMGESEPLLLVEDPTASPGQNEAMHYGRIERLEPIERTQADKNRLELRIREML
jgi:hypothetical protein